MSTDNGNLVDVLAAWGRRHMLLAQYMYRLAHKSPAPSGCVIADDRNRVVSAGYAGLPRGVEDHHVTSSERLGWGLSSVENALSFCQVSPEGCNAFVFGCLTHNDVALMLQNKIRKIIVLDFFYVLGSEERQRIADFAQEVGSSVRFMATDYLKDASDVLRSRILSYVDSTRVDGSDQYRGHQVTDAKWDIRLMTIARIFAEFSRDPSTKVGCVVADKKKRFVSAGFNGFPQGSRDFPELYNNRETKYPRTIHAEKNALSFSPIRNLDGHEAYVTLEPCLSCRSFLIQKGISRITVPPFPRHMRSNTEAGQISWLSKAMEGDKLMQILGDPIDFAIINPDAWYEHVQETL